MAARPLSAAQLGPHSLDAPKDLLLVAHESDAKGTHIPVEEAGEVHQLGLRSPGAEHTAPCCPAPFYLPCHSLGVHSEHHAKGGVTTGCKVVSVPAHSNGVQPVPHSEVPTATTAPSEVKAAPGKDRGWAPGSREFCEEPVGALDALSP